MSISYGESAQILVSSVRDVSNFAGLTKDFRASGLGQVRRLTAATAAITLARLFVEMLCYVLGRLHSRCVLSTRIGLHRIEVIKFW